MKYFIVILTAVTIAVTILFLCPSTSRVAAATANFTASSNISLDFWNPDDIEEAMTNAFLAYCVALSEAINTITDNTLNTILIFVICILVTGAAFWRNKVFLDILAVIVDISYGTIFASNQVVKSPGWIEGLVIAFIGTWILFNRVKIEFENIRARRKSRVK